MGTKYTKQKNIYISLVKKVKKIHSENVNLKDISSKNMLKKLRAFVDIALILNNGFFEITSNLTPKFSGKLRN